MQTQTSNTLHNAIMEAGSKDRPPMLAPVSEGSPITTTEKIRETYKNVSQDIRDQLNAEAEAIQIILTRIDNDIYSTVDACLNACEMWKAIERLKQGESINVQDLKTNLYWEFGKFTSQHGESLESYYSRFYKMMNELIKNQCKSQELKTVSYHKLYDILKQHQHEVNEIKAEKIACVTNPLALVAQQQPDKEIDKLMALISLSFKRIYKPTNNNLQTSSNTSRVNQDNSPRINRNAGYENQRNGTVAGARETKPKRAKDAAYHREKMLLCKQEEAGIQLNAEQADWRDDTDDDELEDQELEAHYMYMAQLQEVSPDAAGSGPIFDDEPLQKVSNDDHYNVLAMKNVYPEQSKSVHDTYPIEQDAQNVIIDSLDMSYDREEIDQNDDDNNPAKERELLASLIEKLKYEIDESKNHNKILETSNKALIEKLKGEIEDFKNKNKSLESSNNFFKEANNRLSETNNLLYADYKKSEAELARRNSKEYASQMELECAKVRGDLLSYKLDYQNSCTKYTDTINALNQMISEMKDKLSAHQETIFILSKQKEAQIKLYKTQEDKELDKVIELENKVKGSQLHDKTHRNININTYKLPSGIAIENEVAVRNFGSYTRLVELVLFIVDSGCSKHMTGNLKLLINFVEKFLKTVKFGNDQTAPLIGYGDLVQGAVTIKTVYYVEGMNHNLFSVGQFCDADLEVAFRKSTCFIRDLKGNDLLTGSRGTDLYSIKLQDTNSPNLICLMAKATSSQAWLWHRRLSHLNFDTINLLSKNDIVVGLLKLKFVKDHLCSSCELGKAKRKDGENLDKMKEKGDECIFVGYSNQSRAYRVFNKRTRVIMQSIHVNFDELSRMASDQISSDPAPDCQTMALNHDSLTSAFQRQANVP
nr:integrase, catalytic region, zinc finger, CCHC-type, peptidase aspartic, catalytic [Tanacetum cinerariifolium]